ncbi:MAG TPA: AmmeMemoRadiSam system radical SAM enzyme [Desulfotomaculum sp.]|nr:MAG: Radical SAM domain protein [Desulfotomaculum sp. 46_80]KUK85007.1 MAG: Radical SAM domain protein [Desulfofundulus kuznetsovii]HBY04007.1 AmmeMemoRadiSam system radical SAM enzyme [Desulfotomaculum sp.]
MVNEALFYEKKEDKYVTCTLCPRVCNIGPGRTGFCRTRKNIDGTLFALNYGRCSSIAMDPIEKKPFYHFYPGANILSMGTIGCNLHCKFCQNWTIARADEGYHTEEISPRKAVDLVNQYRQKGRSCIGIAYTYSEPFTWFEFVLETAQTASEQGIKNVLVTNGYINKEPLQQILPYIDAMNIDVKGFTDEYYRSVCSGKLGPVVRTVEEAFDKCHVELTTLLVPGLNDSLEDINGLVSWTAGLDREIPLHFSRYFPNYKMDQPATPIQALQKAWELAKEKLDYVYVGNAPQLNAGNTYCPQCKFKIIERYAYTVRITGLNEKKCRRCGYPIRLVGGPEDDSGLVIPENNTGKD